MPAVAHLNLPLHDEGAVDFAEGSVLFVGTATTVIRYAGFTMLTDPNFLHAGDHVHLGYGLISKRLTDPALEIDQLPPLDLCVLSHLHADHFDRVAAARLPKDLPIATTPHAARNLSRKGFTATHPLGTWDSLLVRRGTAALSVTAMPGKHAPGFMNAMLPAVMGSLLEFAVDGKTLVRMYISGDTLIHDDLEEIPRRYPDIDLALLHLGGTRILGIMVTMDGDQGVEAMRIVRARKYLPIHYDDYPVFKSPLSDFRRAVMEAGLMDKVVWLRRGETYTFKVPAAHLAGA